MKLKDSHDEADIQSGKVSRPQSNCIINNKKPQ